VDESRAARSRGDREGGDSTERRRKEKHSGQISETPSGQTRFILRSTWRTPREDQKSLLNSSDTFEIDLRDVATDDRGDRYDRDHEGRTVWQDDGRGDRQNVVHQESAGLSWD